MGSPYNIKMKVLGDDSFNLSERYDRDDYYLSYDVIISFQGTTIYGLMLNDASVAKGFCSKFKHGWKKRELLFSALETEFISPIKINIPRPCVVVV